MLPELQRALYFYLKSWWTFSVIIIRNSLYRLLSEINHSHLPTL